MLMPFSDKRKIEQEQIWKRKVLVTLFTGHVIFKMCMKDLNEDVRQDFICLACTGGIQDKYLLFLHIIKSYEKEVISQRETKRSPRNKQQGSLKHMPHPNTSPHLIFATTVISQLAYFKPLSSPSIFSLASYNLFCNIEER